MAVVTIVATVVLLLTRRSANKTNKSAIMATRAAIASNEIARRVQRPWVSLKAKIASDLIIGDDGARLTVGLTAENFGSVPAQKMRIASRLSCTEAQSIKAKNELIFEARAFHHALDQDPSVVLSETGTILFPQKDFTITDGLMCRRSDLDDWINEWRTAVLILPH